MTIKGNKYVHCYPPLIDQEIFDKCQQVRLRANKTPFKYAAKEFLFRGLLHCKDCGCLYTSYTKKERFTYLRPTHRKPDCQCFPMREELATQQVEEIFKSIQMPESLVAEIRDHLKQSHNAKIDYQEKEINALRKEYDGIKGKLNRLVDMLIDQSITQNIYDTKVQELQSRQREVERHLNAHTKADETFNYTLSALLGLTARAHECFLRANIEQKRKLLTLVFANLEMQGGTLCYTLRKPFDALVYLPDNEKWRARQDSNL